MGVVRGRHTPWILAWLAMLPVAVLRAGLLGESDTFWQVRTGLLTMAQHAVPSVDPFSWTLRGEPWLLNSWGFNVIVGVSYRAAGLPGVALTCSALFLTAAGLVLLLARRLGATPLVSATLLLLAMPLLIPWFSARPQLVDYVAVLLLVLLLLRIADRRTPLVSIVGVGLLMCVWANLHAAALLGAAIVGTSAALLIARRESRTSGYYSLIATVVALAGSLATPFGLRLFRQTVQVRSASAPVVLEWEHLTPTRPVETAMFLIGVAALLVAVRRRDLAFTAALLVTAVSSLAALRILPVLVLLAVPVLASTASQPTVLSYGHRMRRVLIPGAAIGLGSLVILAAPSLGHIGQPDPQLYPAAVVDEIPRNCHLVNSYLLGGFVILLRPDVAVSIDSRNDLYGPERVAAAERLVGGGGDVDAELAGAGCVLVPPSSGLAKRLSEDPRWQLHASEAGGALFVRVPSGSATGDKPS